MLYRSLEKSIDAEPAEATKINPTGTQDNSTSSKMAVPTKPGNRQSTHTDPLHSDGPAQGSSLSITQQKTKSPNEIIQPPAAAPKIKSDPILKKYGASIVEASRKFNLDPKLIYSVIAAESGGQDDAISPRGAKGLMQLTDSTATQMGVSDSLDPHQNIVGGAKYLRELLNRYDGDLRLTLAAYNAGPGAVAKYDGVPPFSETREYIDKVLGWLNSNLQ